jgi:hypothetical protein
MTLLPPGVKVHLAFGYIDMRKGIVIVTVEHHNCRCSRLESAKAERQ